MSGTISLWTLIWPNVVSDVLYTLLIAAGVFVITALLLRRERRQLFQFLGISRSQPSLRVLVSRLDVMRGGSRGADGPLEVGFTGPALIHLEYLGAQAITRLVKDPILEALPNPVRRALGRRSAYLDDVRTRIEVSPAETGVAALMERGSDAVVLLGSDVYSHLVRRLYDAPESFVHFVGEESGQPFRSALDGEEEPTFAVRLDERWYPVPARSVARELGTVQRITLRSGRRFVMCAGISSSSTHGTASYLARSWRDLHDRFGSDDFLVVLSFPDQEPDSHLIQAPQELPDFERRSPPGARSRATVGVGD